MTVSHNFCADLAVRRLSSGALLARNSRPRIDTCGLLVAILRQGGGALQLRAGISSETGPIAQGPIGICSC